MAGWLLNVVIGSLLAVTTAPATERVSTKIEFRGTMVRQALEKLGDALQERVIISRQVPSELLDRDIRLRTEYLTPEQAVRWVARLADLEAIHTKEGFYVALSAQLREMSLPLEGTQRVLLALPGSGAKPSLESEARRSPELRELLARTGPVFWHDTPLSRVSADVARIFGIDLIVHDQIVEEGLLVEWEQPQASLAMTCDRLAEVLGAAVEHRDGAIWIHPPDPAVAIEPPPPAATQPAPAEAMASAGPPAVDESIPTTRPAERERVLSLPEPVPAAVTTAPAAAPTASPSPPLAPLPSPVSPRADTVASRPSPSSSLPPEVPASPPVAVPVKLPVLPEVSAPAKAIPVPQGRLKVDTSIRDWPSFARHLETATGWGCQLEAGGRRYEPMEIEGPAAQVLEVLKLMGRLDYRYVQTAPSTPPVIELQIRASR